MSERIALLYHDIVSDLRFEASGFQGPDADIYKLDCEEFCRHLRQISERSKTAPGIVANYCAESQGGQLLLTFDDGGVSAIQHTAEMLEKYGWPGHFFVTTDYIGTPGFLDDNAIRWLFNRGHVIGSHSCSHPPRMSRCTAADLEREWRDSVHRLEDILGERVTTASVPGGYYDRKVTEAAALAGIRVLFTSEPVTSSEVVQGCLVVGRFSVQQGVPAEWVGAVVSGRLGPRLERYLFWNSKKFLKAAGGERWLAMRKNILAWRARVSRD